jgi:nucleoside-diphosphate kinase
MERTLLLIKPDALQRDLVGRILSRVEEKGLQLVGIKMVTFTRSLLADHYSHLMRESFFPSLADYMTSAPTVAVCVEGVDAVATLRLLCGVTKARVADPGTIRGDLAMSVQRNLVHASDSVETARLEIAKFFDNSELFTYQDALTTYVYSAMEAK